MYAILLKQTEINLNAAVDDIVIDVYTANGDILMNSNGTNDDSN